MVEDLNTDEYLIDTLLNHLIRAGKLDNVAGFVSSPGTKYKMHEWTWSQGFQPRLGATWAYNGSDTVFASLARYMPPANSDARAASWDRNLVQAVNAYFDANGNLIGTQPNSSSSGKWWQAGIKPPEIKEFMLGTARQLMSAWSARLYGRAPQSCRAPSPCRGSWTGSG